MTCSKKCPLHFLPKILLTDLPASVFSINFTETQFSAVDHYLPHVIKLVTIIFRSPTLKMRNVTLRDRWTSWKPSVNRLRRELRNRDRLRRKNIMKKYSSLREQINNSRYANQSGCLEGVKRILIIFHIISLKCILWPACSWVSFWFLVSFAVSNLNFDSDSNRPPRFIHSNGPFKYFFQTFAWTSILFVPYLQQPTILP